MSDTINARRKCRVTIDAGHGGSDSGAWVNGVREADHNLKVALALAPILRAEGHAVFLTRKSDASVSLTERGCISVRNRSDLFLSLHADDRRPSTAGGLYGFCHRRTYRNGLDLATKVAQRLNGELQIGYSYANWYEGRPAWEHWLINQGRKVGLGVFRGCDNAVHVTAALIECCTLSKSSEAALAKQPGYPERVALALANGIHDHLGLPAIAAPEPTTTLVKVCRHSDGAVLAELRVVRNGFHHDDADYPVGKIFVANTSLP